MTAWAHLPNARHIDAILVDAKCRPAVWCDARNAAWGADRDAAWDVTRNAAWDAASDAARSAARDAAWNAILADAECSLDIWRDAQAASRNAAGGAAWDAAWGAVRDAAWDAAWDAIAALVAFDDCAYLLDKTPETIRLHYAVTKDPSAILLLPAAIALAPV